MRFIKHDISSDFIAGYSSSLYEYNAEMLADRMAITLIRYRKEIIEFLKESNIGVSVDIPYKNLNDKLLLKMNKNGVSNVMAYLLADKKISKEKLKVFSKSLQGFIALMYQDSNLKAIYDKRFFNTLVEEQKKRRNEYRILAKNSVISYILLIGTLGLLGYAVFNKPDTVRYYIKNFVV